MFQVHLGLFVKFTDLALSTSLFRERFFFTLLYIQKFENLIDVFPDLTKLYKENGMWVPRS